MPMPKQLAERLRAEWEQRPLAVILVAAAAFRLLAALFSKGYGMYDDHFFTVEVAQRWVEGHRDWLGDPSSLHALLYPGLHYLLFAGLERIGLADPQLKMLVVRVMHGAYSLLTVYFGYRTVLAVSDARKARLAGLLLAIFWLVPFTSVRDLVEVVCQPPLVAGLYLLVRDREAPSARSSLLAGVLFGLAFAVRFQTVVLGATVGVVLLTRRRWLPALALAVGFALSAFAFLGSIDWIAYGRPFSSVLAYLAYNADPANIQGYPVGPWYRYLGLLAGVLIPPVSLLLLFGFLRTWRRQALLFWPTLAFLVFHSIYPNKQERFLLPVLPLVLMLGVIGWEELAERSAWWSARPAVSRWVWGWFWAVNLVALVLLSTTYSKKTRVESLSYLRARPDVHGIVFETSEQTIQTPPLFYLGRQVPTYPLPSARSVASLQVEIEGAGSARPNYVVFMGQDQIQARVARVSQLFPTLAFETRIEPSPIDRLAHLLNPRHNVNLACDIYRVPVAVEPTASGL
jgi:hypothetical protein